MDDDIIMTLYCYATGEAIRELTDFEGYVYRRMIEDDSTHTGAVPGDLFGCAGVTVYAA